jgi:hypothetical protein
MAAETLITGHTTITGEQYPTMVVDYGRDAALTFAVQESDEWDEKTTSHPWNQLTDWSLLVLQKSGAMGNDVVMDIEAWKAFQVHPDVVDVMKMFNISGINTELTSKVEGEGATYVGTLKGFNFYVYAGWYLDDNGVEQPIMPTGTVLMLSKSLMGVRAFGAIRDEMAGFAAVPYFPKSWVEQDPSVRYMMTQSAPLVVPERVNASLCASVL